MNHSRMLLLALVAGAPLLQATPSLRLTPVPPERRDEPISLTGGPVELSYEASCSPSVPGLGLVRLQWRPASEAAGVQRVDVSPFPEGFASGRYSVSDLLEPSASEGLLERMEPGVNYFWRVLRRSDAGWLASQTGRFEAPTCPVDRIIAPDAR